MSTVSIDTAALPVEGQQFATDAEYLQYVMAQAISSWQRQYAGSTRAGAITAARLAYNAGVTGQNAGPAVPLEITPRQAELALLGAGLDGAVDAAIAAMPAGPQKRAAEITWRRSTAVQRFHPLIMALGPQLGLTEAQIDQLFIAAKAL